VVACGKVRWAAALGRSVPLAYGLVDKDGQATTEPSALDDQGAVRPFGGHKGFGIGVMIDLLTAGLWGAHLSTSVTQQRSFAKSQSSSQTVIAIPYPGEGTAPAIDEYLGRLKETPSGDGYRGRTLLPGEREELVRAHRLEKGVPVPRKVIADVSRIVAELGT